MQYIGLILQDSLIVPVAWMLAYFVQNASGFYQISMLERFVIELPFVLVIQGFYFWLFGLFRGVRRYTSMADFARIIKAVGLGAATMGILFELILQMPEVNNIFFATYFFALSGLLGSARLSYRWVMTGKRMRKNGAPVLIVGAGQGGELLLRDLLHDKECQYRAIGFLDDDLSKQGREIHGVRVLGRISDIPRLVNKLKIEQIFIAIPSSSSVFMRDVSALCRESGVSVRTLPGLARLAKQKVTLSLLREISLEDLLGREPVNLDRKGIEQSLFEKIILITGAGGSIGSELCHQIAQFNPRQIIIIDHNEFNVYSLQMNMAAEHPNQKINYELCSVINEDQIKHIFTKYKPQIVFHAAAYKHVPILEDQIQSAIFNNIIGTKIIADEAIANRVEKFVLISTDKAVNPTNIMGATKRAAEIYCQSFPATITTKFITVRFGNVLGSAGSVIPLFSKQIETGGPVTVTHPDTMRYFMTIPEACQLILQAFVLGQDREIFVLEMGLPVKIKDLAEQMILMSGFRLNTDIKISYIGLRPGEKMVEELFYSNEDHEKTVHKKILKAQSMIRNNAEIDEIILNLRRGCMSGDESLIMTELVKIVPEYLASQCVKLNEAV